MITLDIVRFHLIIHPPPQQNVMLRHYLNLNGWATCDLSLPSRWSDGSFIKWQKHAEPQETVGRYWTTSAWLRFKTQLIFPKKVIGWCSLVPASPIILPCSSGQLAWVKHEISRQRETPWGSLFFLCEHSSFLGGWPLYLTTERVMFEYPQLLWKRRATADFNRAANDWRSDLAWWIRKIRGGFLWAPKKIQCKHMQTLYVKKLWKFPKLVPLNTPKSSGVWVFGFPWWTFHFWVPRFWEHPLSH